LNHLGVEVASSDEVWAHQSRLSDQGVDSIEESGTCCFAKQDKVWVDGPDGAWEIYTVLADSDAFGQSSSHVDDQTDDGLCCASVPEAENCISSRMRICRAAHVVMVPVSQQMMASDASSGLR